MYISNLEIKNYRNFKDFSLKLKPLTLLVGENNIGKSNLLDSIGLIFSQEVSFFKRRMLEVSDFNHQCIIAFKSQVLDEAIPAENILYPEIKVVATLVDWDSSQEAVIADWYSNSQFTEASLTYHFAPIASFNKVAEINSQRAFIQAYRLRVGEEVFNNISLREKLDLINFPISKYYYSIFGGNQRDSQANAYHLNQLKFELLDALRDAKTELVASHNSRLLFRVLNSKDEAEYQDLKTHLVGLQEAIDTNAALQSLKQNISIQLDKISLITEGENNLVDFIFSLPNVEDLLKKISLIYGSDSIKIERNGTGRNNLLFISLILSYIEDSTRPQSSFFRVIGLEEPEAHLHPNLQDHLAANVEKLINDNGTGAYRKDIQFLLTSHSTHVTTKITFEKTVVLYRNADSISAHYVLDGFPSNAQGQRNLKYLNKYLDAVNTNLFYSRRVVLVEGISEKLLIPAFFQIYKNEPLERFSCCVINVNGLAFRNFLEIIRNGYFIKSLVLTDRDTGTAVENRGEALLTEYGAVDQIKIGITASSTFEKDIVASNRTGLGRLILLKALIETRPNAGRQHETELAGADLDPETFFTLIEGYKSDFAYSLMIELNNDSNGFVIPGYITAGFDFVIA